MNFFVRAIVIVVIFAFAKGMFGSLQEKTQKFSKVRTVSFENSEHFKKASEGLRLESIKKFAKPASQGSLSVENDRLLAEIKKNTEALNQIQSQLHLQEFATQQQNKMLQQQRSIQHWQGISRMMNVLNN